ncbi:MAG TPA: hypothetical protein VF595_01105 [Tepidisphaeraceae bacterium]|jgi:hypothetical protein
MEAVKQLNATQASRITKFAVDIETGDNGENARTVPIKLLARTSDPVYVDFLDGYMVHDFATMNSKSRVPLDYAHDQYQSIGYLNKIELKDNALTCSGALVPYSANPRDPATEVIYKMRAGVPYEASIQTDLGDLSYADDGSLVTLNGRTYDGFSPLFVMSNWNLMAVAVCKFGRDGATATELMSKGADSARPVEVKITKRETLMSEENKAVEPAVETPVVEAPAVVDPVVEAPVVEAPVVETPVAVEAEPTEKKEETPAPVADVPTLNSAVPAVADAASVAKQYLTQFGAELGMTYLASGLSIEDAKTQHLTHLSAQVADLTKRLAAVDRGAPTPVQFSAAPRDEGKPQKMGLAGVVSVGKSSK